MQRMILGFLFVSLFTFSPLAAAEHHDHRVPHEPAAKHDDHERPGVALTAAQRRTVGIAVEPLAERELHDVVRAPGEVRLNGYATTRIAPRIGAQVVRRHVRLGDRVRRGAVLVTLSSVDMAAAQGELKVADREWRRVERLGSEVVSERRFTEARVAYELARSKVLSFGMTEDGIDALLSGKRDADGEFALLAAQDGTVIADDFVEGVVVEPGRVLLTLSDESRLWVETRLTPEQAANVAVGAGARVTAPAGTLRGRVVQFHHALDEATRTIGARIEVPNPDDRLHAGQFVDVHLDSRRTERAPALPKQAVLRAPDGDWQVFVEAEEGRFEPREVDMERTVGDWVVVHGIAPGTPVVTRGAFFVQSELAKGGFEVHRH